MTSRTRSLPRRHAIALAIALALPAAGADAASITVASLLDGPVTADGICTLREALESINGAAAVGGCTATGAFGTADAVTVTATGTITLNPVEGALQVLANSSITGPGATQLTISGGGAVPVLYVEDATVSVSGVTLANGDSGTPGAGGADVFYGSLTLSNCAITGNSGGYGSGALGVYSNLTINNCTISGNTGAAGGAVALIFSSATITGSTITGNQSGAIPTARPRAGNAAWERVSQRGGHIPRLSPEGAPGLGGGISAFGAFFGGGDQTNSPQGGTFTLAISRSTISGNSAQIVGGGAFLYGTATTTTDSTISGNTAQGGSGIFSVDSPFQLANSTVSGNSSTAPPPNGGGAIALYAAAQIPAAIQSSTITGNTAAANAGGVVLAGGAALALQSTIVANSSGGTTVDIASVGQVAGVVTASNSLVENPGTSGVTAAGANLVGVDPVLGPLANNGGTTFTHLPLITSPAINAGANPTGVAFDQRGTPFARVSGPAADIGSIERPATQAGVSFVANVPTTTTWGGLLLAAALAAIAWLRRPRPARRRR